jgi:hypothetical protein
MSIFIKLLAVAAMSIAFTSATSAAFAQYADPEVKSVHDLFKPDADCRGAACNKRACRMEIDGTSVPCELVWYIEFKDGSHAVQFNKGTGNKPMVSFSGSEGDADTIKVDTVMIRNGGRSVATDESEATGFCHLNKSQTTMACQARMHDGQVVVGSISATEPRR